MKAVALFLAILLALLALPLLFPAQQGPTPQPQPDGGLPWQIEKLADGTTRVFGLVPGRTSFDEARRQIAGEPQVALLVAPGESGALEAYYDSFAAQFVTGRLVLSLDSTFAQRERMAARARKVEYLEGTTRRVHLGEADLIEAGRAVVSAVSFIPAANLDEQIVLQRFGVPAERIRSSAHTEHFLYPELGLDLQLDAKGKELLQYVAPREFARLRDPLQNVAR